jgi:cobalt-zinc-cadmium efflux system outer membrane protein
LLEVLTSVERYYPLLRAIEQERVISGGQLLSARGAFDLNLRAREGWQQGSYDSERFDIGFEQPTPFQGATLYSGYRVSGGKFPVYYGERETADGGEFRAGMQLPLWRDRQIDRRRAGIQQAEIGRQIAEPNILSQRIDFQRGAARAYWNWLAAGRRFLTADHVLQIALIRNRQLEERVKRGALAPIEVTDNQRTIVDRQARRVVAFRIYQQAAIAMSLYLRDETGAPQVVPPERLPPGPGFPVPQPPPNDDQVKHDLQLAFQQRPELRRLQLQRERTNVDLRLAENQQAPGVNAVFYGAQDVGAGKSTLDRYNYEAAVQVDVPLQRREARGKAQSARGALAQILAQEQFARDRITAELSDAWSAMQRAFDLRGQCRRNVELAGEMQRAEQTKFDVGQSNLIFVNLRELATVEAEFLEIDALAEYFRAWADYRAALGIDTLPESPALFP